MSREQDAARARSEAAQAASLLTAIEKAVGEALADCTDADAREGYNALVADVPKLRHAITVNTEDLLRENGFTYPRGERATRNLDAVRAMLRAVEAYDPDEYVAAKRRERAAAAASEAAKVAALEAADAALIAARARCATVREELEGVNYALNSSTIEDTLAMGSEARAYYAGLRAKCERLDAEVAAANEAAKAARAAREAAYRVVSFAAARDSDWRLEHEANERARQAHRAHRETEDF